MTEWEGPNYLHGNKMYQCLLPVLIPIKLFEAAADTENSMHKSRLREFVGARHKWSFTEVKELCMFGFL